MASKQFIEFIICCTVNVINKVKYNVVLLFSQYLPQHFSKILTLRRVFTNTLTK